MSIREAVSAAELDRHLQAVAGEVRLSGSPEEARAFDYIQEELERFGYAVKRYQSEALIGYPRRASLHVLGADPSPSTPTATRSAPAPAPRASPAKLVYVGAGQAADYAGSDVAGQDRRQRWAGHAGQGARRQPAGAIGQIHINDEHIHEMCISPVWGTPIPETAALLPRRPGCRQSPAQDGERFSALWPPVPSRVRLVTEPYRAWTMIPTLTADLPGHGGGPLRHLQRPCRLLALRRRWTTAPPTPPSSRSARLAGRAARASCSAGVRLAFWSGHSHGRYASSAWYADHHWHDLHERCVCHVNVDSVGAKGRVDPGRSADDGRDVRLRPPDPGRDTPAATCDYRRISRSSDQSFWGHGIPTLFASLSEQARGRLGDRRGPGAAPRRRRAGRRARLVVAHDRRHARQDRSRQPRARRRDLRRNALAALHRGPAALRLRGDGR